MNIYNIFSRMMNNFAPFIIFLIYFVNLKMYISLLAQLHFSIAHTALTNIFWPFAMSAKHRYSERHWIHAYHAADFNTIYFPLFIIHIRNWCIISIIIENFNLHSNSRKKLCDSVMRFLWHQNDQKMRSLLRIYFNSFETYVVTFLICLIL